MDRIAKANTNPDDINMLIKFFKTNLLDIGLAGGKYGADDNEIEIDDALSDDADENEIDIDDDDLDDSHSDLNDKDDTNVDARDSVLKSKADSGAVSSPLVENCPTVETTKRPGLDSVPTNRWPHLLVLGTGCAAPSPLRGASGYGLLLPQVQKRTELIASMNKAKPAEELLLTAIFECGEGTLNMLLRHLPPIHSTAERSESLLDIHLRHVKFIWISHAHYDHYGGLPALVNKVHEARLRYHRIMQQTGHIPSKRMKTEFSEPPVLIVAPRKVLDYLNISLDASRARNNSRGVSSLPLFQGYTHEQLQSWWPRLSSIQITRVSGQPSAEAHDYSYRPFCFWTNVRVEHSCFRAFGFVCGIKVPLQNFNGDMCGVQFNADQADAQKLTLAYSGDTRPCWSFVQQCLKDCNAFNKDSLGYLIHEATFDDADQAKSIEKKHSSLSEALRVAEDTRARKVILTHFSQRYVQYPPMQLDSAPASLLHKKAVVSPWTAC